LNILIVSQYFWPENFRINDLARDFVEQGNEVVVLTGIPNYPEGRFFKGFSLFKNRHQVYNGAKIIRVPLWPRGRSRHWELILNYASFAVAACFRVLFLYNQKFDVIFVYETSPITVALPAIFFKKMKKIPLVMWVLDLWPESLSATNAVKSRFILKRVDSLVRFIYRHCDRLFIASRGFISSIESRGGDPGKTRFFPNWAEEVYEQAQPACAGDLSKKLPKGFRIMFAGNIGVSQDFDAILTAAEKLKHYPDIHWLFLGEGRMSEWVKEQIRSRNLDATVHLLGRHPLDAMPQFFACADAMLVTLKSDAVFSVTIPGKIQSYLACSKPIVAALDGAGRSLLEECGAGIVCPAGDPDGLSEAVLKMSRFSDEERAALGRKGKKYYQDNFDRRLLFDKAKHWMLELIPTKK
jgi:glycosyltransferase involved in cell wall biosynthesis